MSPAPHLLKLIQNVLRNVLVQQFNLGNRTARTPRWWPLLLQREIAHDCRDDDDDDDDNADNDDDDDDNDDKNDAAKLKLFLVFAENEHFAENFINLFFFLFQFNFKNKIKLGNCILHR